MCGIAGIVTERKAAGRDLDRTIRTMTGDAAPPRAGRRRLSGGRQGRARSPEAQHHRPQDRGASRSSTRTGSKCIVFNGEIYNYQEISDELLRHGHRFSTASDTETILHAYEEWGEDCVTRLNGMFAFCIWDRTAETLFLARDRLGEKPLFYGRSAGSSPSPRR